MRRLNWLAGVVTLGAVLADVAAAAPPNRREIEVRKDKQEVESQGAWIYNDLPRGVEEAKKSGKPLLVVFRCIPCDACAQLDEQVVERDPAVRGLLDKFVCVRIVQANGLDLTQFQYDYDQSWAAFFLNADMTIYGRYGTRSHQTESHNDVSLEGFGKALEAALALHADYPRNKDLFGSKRGPQSSVKVPEEFPALKGKYTSKLDYEGNVVQSCIHCHQVGEGLRQVHRLAGKPVPDQVLFPYPNPKIFGLILDPKEKAKVRSVAPGSTAEMDGFRAGDEIVKLEGQPILSIADVQWVLHHAGDAGQLRADVLRGGELVPLMLTLAQGWRRRDDIGWRATSWDLRRMAGGMKLDEATAEERAKANLSDTALALRVRYLGQYGPHATAKQSGLRVDDVLVAIDGRTDRMREGDFLALIAQQTRPGDKLNLTVLRNGQRLDIKLPIQ